MAGLGGAFEPEPPPVVAVAAAAVVVVAGRNPAPPLPPPPLKWDEATTSPVLLRGPRLCCFGVPVSEERTDAAAAALLAARDPNGRKGALVLLLLVETGTTLPATLLGISCGPVRVAVAGVEGVVPAAAALLVLVVVSAPARPSELPAALNPPPVPPGAVPAIVESLGESVPQRQPGEEVELADRCVSFVLVREGCTSVQRVAMHCSLPLRCTLCAELGDVNDEEKQPRRVALTRKQMGPACIGQGCIAFITNTRIRTRVEGAALAQLLLL